MRGSLGSANIRCKCWEEGVVLHAERERARASERARERERDSDRESLEPMAATKEGPEGVIGFSFQGVGSRLGVRHLGLSPLGSAYRPKPSGFSR